MKFQCQTLRLVLASLLSISRVNADLLVVLLERRKVLTSLRELTLLHTLTDVPVDEGTLGVEEIELVVETRPGSRDGSGVGEHAKRTRNLGEVTAGDVRWRLVADTELEASWAPVDELNGTLRLDNGNSGVDILGDNITTVQKRTSHYGAK